MLCRKGVLRNSAKFTGKHLFQSLWLWNEGTSDEMRAHSQFLLKTNWWCNSESLTCDIFQGNDQQVDIVLFSVYSIATKYFKFCEVSFFAYQKLMTSSNNWYITSLIEMRLRRGSSEINWLPSSLFLSGITNFCFRVISIFTEGKFTTSSATYHFGPSFFFWTFRTCHEEVNLVEKFLVTRFFWKCLCLAKDIIASRSKQLLPKNLYQRGVESFFIVLVVVVGEIVVVVRVVWVKRANFLYHTG